VTKASKPSESTLQAAVLALDEELVRFEQLAQSARRVPLTSERNLEKAASTVNQAAESQQRVYALLQALNQALSTVRIQHEHTAEELVKTRDEVQARSERLQTLRERFASLGSEAAGASSFMREWGELKEKPRGELVAQLGEVQERLTRIVDGAATLGKEAENEHLEDLGRQCDSLKQQMRSLSNKVSLLRDKLAATLS
jgi:chromosome segregation ATPase